MTYESLVAEFRLRVLRTDEDYAAAKAFWDERVSLAIKFCRLHDADGVQDYAEVLTLLMGRHEQKKLDEYEENDEPTEPDEEDLVTADHEHFYSQGGGFAFSSIVGGANQDWREVAKKWMKANNFYPNVWLLSDHGSYTLLNLGDE